jgi:dipeptidase E
MKLYLSSIDVPTPSDLEELLGKPLGTATVAVIPNAQDYYSERARQFKNDKFASTLISLGLTVETVDLREYSEATALEGALSGYDLIWARGGNAFCLRYEMHRSKFDEVIVDLLRGGTIYGGDSAGALVAGKSIAGIESADIPQFAEEVIEDGLGLVPYTILPHVDNPEFADAVATVRDMNKSGDNLIELRDSQAFVYTDGTYEIVDSKK